MDIESARKELGRRIATHRKLLSLTQAELAERGHLDQTHLARLEQGVRFPSIRTLLRIAEALGVPTGILLDGSGHELEEKDHEIQEILRSVTSKELALLKDFLAIIRRHGMG